MRLGRTVEDTEIPIRIFDLDLAYLRERSPHTNLPLVLELVTSVIVVMVLKKSVQSDPRYACVDSRFEFGFRYVHL